MSHPIQTPSPRRPPAPGGPPPGMGVPSRPPAPPSLSKPLLIGDLSFVLIGMTGVLAIALAIVTAVLIGAMSGTDLNLTWFTTRGSGIAAYVLMVGVMVYGLLLSTRSNSGELPAPVSYGMHDYLTWLSLGFTALHVCILLLDKYIPYTLPLLLIPLASPYEPLWVGAGQIGLYLSLAVTLSLYARRRIGQRAWRAIHYLSFGSFVLVAAHGFFSGTDSKLFVMQAMYAGSLLLVSGLTIYRVIASRRGRQVRRVA
ncbi:MAG: hypothetical protein ABIQ99_15550 [Thermoflexales bacterium]